MAYSKVPFTYTSGPQVFPTNFALGVLEVDHIKVYVDGVVDGLGEPVEYAFTYNEATGDVTVTDTLTSGQTGTINRIVPVDTLIADFEVGADVSKRNLVRAVKQTLMAVQEAADGREADSQLIADTVQDIEDLTDAIADDVAAVAAAVVDAEGFANSASASADASAASAIASSEQAAIAATQAGLAEDARVAAEEAVASAGLPSFVGNALKYLRVNAAATAYELVDLAVSAILTAISALSSTGIIVRTGDGTVATRTIQGTNTQITVTNGSGVGGNPTISAVVASQAEAEAGVDSMKLMTPQRVRQAGLGRPHAEVYDEKATNTAANTTTAAAWSTVDLNTEDDPQGIVSVSGNAFTCNVSAYVEAKVVPYSLGVCRLRLYNVTDGVAVAYSQSGYGHPSYSGTPDITLHADIVSGKSYRLEFYKASAGTSHGTANNITGVPEKYASVNIWRR